MSIGIGYAMISLSRPASPAPTIRQTPAPTIRERGLLDIIADAIYRLFRRIMPTTPTGTITILVNGRVSHISDQKDIKASGTVSEIPENEFEPDFDRVEETQS